MVTSSQSFQSSSFSFECRHDRCQPGRKLLALRCWLLGSHAGRPYGSRAWREQLTADRNSEAIAQGFRRQPRAKSLFFKPHIHQQTIAFHVHHVAEGAVAAAMEIEPDAAFANA